MTPVSSPAGDTPVLVALCENSWFTEEMDEAHCMGRLHFRWGMGQAKCDTCGAWCGITVAKWERVEPAAASSSSPDDTAPGPDAMHVVSQHRGQEVRDVTPIRAWAEDLVSRGGTNAAVGRGVLAKLNEGQRAAASAAVPDTAPAPGYDRIAPAIEIACEVADMDVEVFQDGSARLDPYRLLAKVLDKAGLIDWSAFTEPVAADGDTEETR